MLSILLNNFYILPYKGSVPREMGVADSCTV